MRGGARLVLVQRVGDAAERLLLDHVVHPEAHLEAAVGPLLHRAHQQRVGEPRAPLGIVDARRLGRLRRDRRQLEAAEEAATLEVGAHDGADAGRQAVFAGERHDGDRDALRARARDFDRQLGVRGPRAAQQEG
jgi:hypothetical protein